MSVCLHYQHTSGLIKWVWECSLFFKFWKSLRRVGANYSLNVLCGPQVSKVCKFHKHSKSGNTETNPSNSPWKTGSLDGHFTLFFPSQGRCCKSAYFWSWWTVLVLSVPWSSINCWALFCSLWPPGIQGMLVSHQHSTSGKTETGPSGSPVKSWHIGHTFYSYFSFLKEKLWVGLFILIANCPGLGRGRCGSNEMALHTHCNVTVPGFEIAWGYCDFLTDF